MIFYLHNKTNQFIIANLSHSFAGDIVLALKDKSAMFFFVQVQRATIAMGLPPANVAQIF